MVLRSSKMADDVDVTARRTIAATIATSAAAVRAYLLDITASATSD
ncbi:hypothetical protein [Gordonia jacobaea]